MSFFDEVDSTGIVEDHIQQVLGLEDNQAKSILEQYQEVRKDLVDRLSRAPRGSFTAQHLRGTLAQVQGAIIAMNKHLGGSMIQGAYQSAMAGIQNLVTEMKSFDEMFTGAVTPINLNAALLAHDTANFLVTKYKTNLDAYGTDLYRQISNGLFSATIGETSYNEVVGRVGSFFNAEEWKLHRIIRTELHGIYNRGKNNGMQKLVDDDTIEDLQKTLMHPMDARTGKDSKYVARLALVVDVDQPFEYEWDGKLRSFMVPPDRPNDRAILVPYRPSWGSSRGPAFTPGTFPTA